jgi:hypothetical protein
MDATGLERHRSKMVVMCLGEAWPEIRDHSIERVAGVEACLGNQAGEAICSL